MSQEAKQEIVSILQRIVEGDIKELSDSDINDEELRLRFNQLCQRLAYIAPVVSNCISDIPVMENSLERIIATTEESVNHLMTSSEQLLDRFNSVKDLLDRTLDSGSDYSINFQKIEDLNQQNQDEIYDMMSSLEFQDITHQIVERMNKMVNDMQMRVNELAQVLKLQQVYTGTHSTTPASKEDLSASDQGLVDKLLAEFGL
ncbi:hypothetical protein [Desulfurispira natronophila]|uniref:Chemotaxis protein CheZ n=1 Tax=Desulfurispira natronophila TaxID=682562 RepID=A0A7W7Y3I8_9BACT|nr:hypothetical protein [Desulfurispira natronophila]MBB5021431.1 chemotaxis protein CheZ [Desulfurispira natronophila]